MSADWSVYIILCSDDSLYTGIAIDVDRRFRQHRESKGAKFFRGRRPERIVYVESGYDRSGASRREWSIKQLKRAQKLRLIFG